MKVFHCDHCGQPVFFENTTCLGCGRLLAYLPDLADIGSLDRDGDDWTSPLAGAATRRYRLCQNYLQANVCNWAIPDTDPGGAFCRACQLTRVIPDLDRQGRKEAWYRLEIAKRRLLYGLIALQLPVLDKHQDPQRGLAFEFLADSTQADAQPILTGHRDGVISINLAEADDAERERRRAELHEPYRTLLGHLRHETGHYYWDILVKESARLGAFRELFGDERSDYRQALDAYYRGGPAADWPLRFVTAYSSAHAWEDWAETWAHYLHIVDTLETAAACGLVLVPRRNDEPSLERVPEPTRVPIQGFDRLLESWFPVTYLLNNLNRGMGLPDGYPFVLSSPAIEKLRFVHETIGLARDASVASPTLAL